MESTRPPNKKAPYKRKMTEKRRNQNRAAQKTYREKRKERLELLEKQVTALRERQDDDDQPNTSQEPNSDPFVSDTILRDPEVQELPYSMPAYQSPESSQIHALKLLLGVSDKDEVNSLLEFALNEQPDLSKVLLTGLRVLKLEKEGNLIARPTEEPRWRPELWPAPLSPTMLPVWPDPIAGGIFLRRQSTIEVCFHNCQQIGLRFEEMTRPNCQSPWYSPFPSPALLPLKGVPPDLYPTPAQRQIPHHPFMDIIPFPWLRERAISLLAANPPIFSWHELKSDILSGGMICWRARGKDEGLPWDRRSWEVLPWFWEKWGWLVEEQGKVEQQSKWWRALRGQ